MKRQYVDLNVNMRRVDMKMLTNRQKTLIMNNVIRACNVHISKLNGPAYRWLNLCSGFIAHYDIHGFKYYYEREANLRRDILNMQPMNQWRNFNPGDRDYEYMMQKKHMYNTICEGIL